MRFSLKASAGLWKWGSASLLGLSAWAFFLRVAAADFVQWLADRKHALCLFPDTDIYWGLAAKLVRGEPFEVTFWGDLPHFALRTPGYPLFLAACQWTFGDRPLPARLLQSLLGAACVYLTARMVERVLCEESKARSRSLGWIAAVLTAFDPYVISNSAFLLSEAVFLPLMLFAQWAFVELWMSEAPGKRAWALIGGAATGGAVLVRPSWMLYLPMFLGLWLLFGKGNLRGRLGGTIWVVLGLVLVMAPWWTRNEAVHGRFVPTALWMGASLYDGISPTATGASDMSFLNSPEYWPLDEDDQDRLLRGRAIEFAYGHPGRVAELALIKAGRFWSPWPNAESFRSLWIAAASSLYVVPIFALTSAGLWISRRNPSALVLLALPLIYTFLLHLIFVSSMRYRIPVFVPAFGFTALGLARLFPNPSTNARIDASPTVSVADPFDP